MPWITIGIPALAAVAGGAISANAAGDAAGAQVNAANQGNALSSAQYQQTRADNQPLVALRNSALGAYGNALGLTGMNGQPLNLNGIQNQSLIDASGGNWAPNQQLYASDPAYKQAYDEFTAQHQAQFGQAPSAVAGSNAGVASQQILQRYQQLSPQAASTGTAGATPAGFGSLLTPFTGANLTSEPGYQFGLNQGQNALTNSLAAKGGLYSGAAGKALDRYATDYAGTKYNDAYQRDLSTKGFTQNALLGAAGMGQQGATSNTNAGNAYTNALTTNAGNIGNALSANSIAQGSALTGAIGGGVNAYQQNMLLQNQQAYQNQLLQALQNGSGYGRSGSFNPAYTA